ncbi:TPA: hypothetical protein DCX16_04120 [bacterium]|nr:hypothetical protein [bacterium]
MQPLFEQVYHGCSAGLYDEVYENIYMDKINRMEELFITRKLGAWETNIFLIRTFFPKGNLSQTPLISDMKNQRSLLYETGLALLAIGWSKEAERSIRRYIDITVESKELVSASRGYQTLVDFQFRTGEIEKALESVKKALKMANEAKSDEDIRNSKDYLGWTLYLLGRREEAEDWFRQAGDQVRISKERLYWIIGIWYPEFLLSIGRINEALQVTKQHFRIITDFHRVNDMSRCYRTFGIISKTKGNYLEAIDHLQKALEFAHKGGIPFLEIEAFIEFSRLDLDRGRYGDAIHKANEALKIVDRTDFKLYEPEAELILAKTHLAQGDKTEAKSYAISALTKTKEMSYKLMENEITEFIDKANF